MPLGLSVRRPIQGSFALGLAFALGSGAAGCSAVPSSSRVVPRAADIRTRTGPERDRAPGSDAVPSNPTSAPPLPIAPGGLAFDRLDDESPLPPAIEAPRPGALRTISDRPGPKQTTTPEPTPLLDEAVSRADATTGAIVDEVVRDAESKARDRTPAPAPASPPATTGPSPTPANPPIGSVVELPPPTVPAPSPNPVTALSPEEAWQDGVRRLRTLARDRLKGGREEARPGSPNWAVRDRLLAWIAEPDIDPDARSDDGMARGRAVLKGLAVVLDPSRPTEARGAEIREAVAALEAGAALEVSELKLCVRVQGFGNIEPLEPASRAPGQPVIVYCEMLGLAYEPIGAAFRSRLAARVELIPVGSEVPAWSHTPDVAEDTCRRRRRDYYVNYRINLPEGLPPGSYRLRLIQKDLVTDRVTSRETALTVAR